MKLAIFKSTFVILFSSFVISLVFNLTVISKLNIVPLIHAEPDCSNPNFGDIDYCLQKLQREIDALSPAQEKNKQDLASLKKTTFKFKY